MSMGIILILMMCTEQCFDTPVLSTFPCYWYHSIQKETLYPIIFANPDYCDLLAEEQKLMK